MARPGGGDADPVRTRLAGIRGAPAADGVQRGDAGSGALPVEEDPAFVPLDPQGAGNPQGQSRLRAFLSAREREVDPLPAGRRIPNERAASGGEHGVHLPRERAAGFRGRRTGPAADGPRGLPRRRRRLGGGAGSGDSARGFLRQELAMVPLRDRCAGLGSRTPSGPGPVDRVVCRKPAGGQGGGRDFQDGVLAETTGTRAGFPLPHRREMVLTGV